MQSSLHHFELTEERGKSQSRDIQVHLYSIFQKSARRGRNFNIFKHTYMSVCGHHVESRVITLIPGFIEKLGPKLLYKLLDIFQIVVAT